MTPYLPEELWDQILSNFSIIEKATRSDAQTWADINNTGDNALHLANDPAARAFIAENVRDKAALSRVSKLFYRLCRPLMLELIDVRSFKSFQLLCCTVARSRDFADDLARYTLRLDVTEPPSSSAVMTMQEQAAQWSADFRILFRICRRLKFVSWLVRKYEGVRLCLFRDLPELCPLVEVLFWYRTGKASHSVLDKLASLRVFHYEFEVHGYEDEELVVDAEDVKLPLLHTLRVPMPLFSKLRDTNSLPNLTVLGLTSSRSYSENFDQTPPLLAHGGKVRSLGFFGFQSKDSLDFRNIQQMCPNATHAIVPLQIAMELCDSIWPTVEYISLASETTRFGYFLKNAWSIVESILCHKEHMLPTLREVRILDRSTVSSLRSSVAERAIEPAVIKCLCGETKVLDEQGKPVWTFDSVDEASEPVPASHAGLSSTLQKLEDMNIEVPPIANNSSSPAGF